jgi:hypothetical protein
VLLGWLIGAVAAHGISTVELARDGGAPASLAVTVETATRDRGRL